MKIKLFVVAAFLISIFASAQEVKFGVKGGLNISFLSLSGPIPSGGSTSSNTGFVIGGVADIKINNKFSMQPELLFSTDGGTYQYTNTVDQNSPILANYYQTIKTSSIAIPVIAKYNVINDLSIDAGLQISYLLNATSTIDYNAVGYGSIVTESTDMTNNQTVFINSSAPTNKVTILHDYQLNKLNFGLVLGTTYNLKNGVFIQARYNLGLTSFTKNANAISGKEVSTGVDGDIRYKGANLKNSSFQVTVGYKFL